VYQTECPPALPAWFGSFVSFVAATFTPSANTPSPIAFRSIASAKSSLTGAASTAEAAEGRNRRAATTSGTMRMRGLLEGTARP
jgi:hypothetical protein